MIVALFCLAIIISVIMVLWQFHWALGLAATLSSLGTFYISLMERLGRKLSGHRIDCLCRKCWPSGHQP